VVSERRDRSRERAFAVHLSRYANFEAVYGSLSSIIVLLLRFYVSALILIFGAEYNIVRSRAKSDGAHRSETADPVSG